MNLANLNRFKTKVVLSFTFMFLFTLQGIAQRVSVNINVNSRPQVYEKHYEVYEEPSYYYYPEIESYFDVGSSVFIYFEGGNWIRSRNLPRYYSNYDLSRGYKVVIDYHGREPYHDFYSHKQKYKCKRYDSCCERNYKHKCYKKKHKKHHDHDDDDDD